MSEGNVLEIDKLIYRLSKEITESEFINPLLLGIPRRGDLIAKRISKNLDQLNYAHDIDTVDYLPFRDDLEEEIEKTKLDINPQERDVILIDDVIYTGRTARAAMEALSYWGRPKKIMLLTMIDRGHRELPIQPDFCGKRVLTNKDQNIELRLKSLDKIEGVFLV